MFSILRLVSLKIRWIMVHRFVLLWCWTFSGWNHCRSLLRWCCQCSEIDHIAPCTSGESGFLRWIDVPLFSGVVRYFFKFGHCAFFFFGVETTVSERIAVSCSSLVLPVQRNQQHRPLHFWSAGFSAVNEYSAILWRSRSIFEFYGGL